MMNPLIPYIFFLPEIKYGISALINNLMFLRPCHFTGLFDRLGTQLQKNLNNFENVTHLKISQQASA